MFQLFPHHVHLLVVLANDYLALNENDKALQFLTRAWELSPNNNYNILCGMLLYLLKVENYSMAEKTCHLVLEMAPHDLIVMGLLTQSLIGQGRNEEALKVGGPLLELAGTAAWDLPEGMSSDLVKRLAEYKLDRKDYAGAVGLWEAGVKCQPGEVDPLLELSRCLLLAGDKDGARRRLNQARKMAPQNEAVLAMLREVEVPRGKKRRH